MNKLLLLALLSRFVWAFPVEVANSPDSTLPLTKKAILAAKKSLQINIYEFTSKEISQALIQKINQGLDVSILQEGQPVGGLSSSARDIQSAIIEAMENSSGVTSYVQMQTVKAAKKRRYRFDHAKYIVVDGKKLLVGSENFGPDGQPVPGNQGNRGWEVFIDSASLGQSFMDVFEKDTDPSHGDIVELSRNKKPLPRLCLLDCASQFLMGTADSRIEGAVALNPAFDTDEAQALFSPTTSLSGLQQVIEDAQESLDLEQMTLAENWGTTGKTSPLITSLVDAARRGVVVRVLLNDDTVFGGSAEDSKNQQAVDYLNQVAIDETLDMEAAVADLKAMGVKIIHNKGVLADGNKTLISSINWNQNSVMNNREAAVLLTSEKIYKYYSALFNADWQTRSRILRSLPN